MARTKLIGGSSSARIRSAVARNSSLGVGMLSVALFLAMWQAVVSLGIVPAFVLPGPIDIAVAAREYAVTGTLWRDLAVSGNEFAIGYGLAVLIAVPLGLLIGRYELLRKATDPFVNFFFSTPTVAFAPLLIIWFGLGIWSKVLVVFIGAFWPILINTAAGVREIDRNLLAVARSMCATEPQIFRTIAFPYSLPYILAGMRLGIGHAIVGVFVAELIASQAGLGKMMLDAGATFQTAMVFVGLFILGIAGILLSSFIRVLERRVGRHKSQ